MRPVSARYLEAIRGSHEAVTRVRLVAPGQTGVTPTGVDLLVAGGSVSIDGAADVRTTADLTLAEAWSDDGLGIAPYGQELYVERGIVFGNGQREFVGLGYLRLEDVGQDDAPLGPLAVIAKDRMAGLIEARLLRPVQYLAGQAVGDVVADLVEAVYPTAVIEWDDATDTQVLARGQIAEEDRHGFIRDLVTSHGKVMFWDHRGVLVIRTPPDPAVAVFDVDAGANGVLVKASRSLSREGVYNAVLAAGEAADDLAPVYAVAYDANPDSLTWWDGPFGKVPRFYTSPFISTAAQALSAATSILSGSLGLPYEVSFGMLPQAALEPYDPVQVTYPPDRSKSTHIRREVHVIATLAIPLEAGAVTCTTRKQTEQVTE